MWQGPAQGPSPEQIAEMRKHEYARARLECLKIAAGSPAVQAGLGVVAVAEDYLRWVMIPYEAS